MSVAALSEESPPSQRAEQPRPELLGGVPHCFILDDDYRVLMAGPSGGDDPLGPLYDAGAGPDALPQPIDRVVRALTASWRSSAAATSVAARVGDLQVTIAPLHGFEGRRIAVFVARTPSGEP